MLIKGDIGNYLTAIDTSVFRGFSISDEVAPFIVINDQDARPAWSFTLLHETVHLLLGQTGVGNARADSEVERFCDDVAGEFLLPMEELDQLVLDQSGDIGAISERISMFASQRNLSRAMVAYPESTEAMGRGVDTRDDGQGKANGASPIPIDGDEGGVR